MEGRFQKGAIPWNKGLKTGIAPANKNQADITCTKCNNNFTVAQYRKDTAKFCSHSCKASFNMSGEKHHQWKGGKPFCKECGVLLSSRSRTYCLEHKGLLYTAEKNWKWITDRSLLKKQEERNGNRHKAWSRHVKNRDGWKCKITNGDCSGQVVAHHILPWRDFIDLRYEVNNGITLCHFHHPRKRNDEMRLSPYFQELVNSK